MTNAAFKATFEDFRIVKGRKVCQLVLEVPLEGADKALEALGGLPRPDDPMWVGVARMGRKEPVEKPKRSWDEIPLSEQAGIRCNDPQFQEWMIAGTAKTLPEKFHWDGQDAAEWTKDRVARICGISSRTELAPDNKPGQRWQFLDEEYRQSQGLIAQRTT